MEPVALSVLVALAIVAILRRPGALAPALAMAEAQPGTATTTDDDDEEMPETDRAPRPLLPWVVAGVAVVRVVLLATLHA